MKGIDISEFQDDVDYDALKNNGIEFVIIRCGFGKNESQKDSCFEKHYSGCKNAGLKVGTYLYSYANTIAGARLEAENCLRFINGKEFDLPVFYDVEDEDTTGTADPFTITKMCETFCDIIQNADYKAGVYASLYWFNSKIYVDELIKKNYSIWLAQWNDTMDAEFHIDYWQYGKGYIEGIAGEVDLDKSYGEQPEPIPDPTYKIGIYQNGSTKEPVYADTDLTTLIGVLGKQEMCECLGIYKNRAIVRYHVDGTKDNYKIGFVKWLGGVQ